MHTNRQSPVHSPAHSIHLLLQRRNRLRGGRKLLPLCGPLLLLLRQLLLLLLLPPRAVAAAAVRRPGRTAAPRAGRNQAAL